MRGGKARRHCATALALSLSACSLAPQLITPKVPAAVVFKETGAWTRAEPADRLPRASWWALYGSARLNELQSELVSGNPTLATAWANYAAARALEDQARAAMLPRLGLNAGVTRNRGSEDAPLRGPSTPTYYDDNAFGGEVSYEFDLWGRIRNEVAAGSATAAASRADLENVRLSLAAQLAANYIQLRSEDRTKSILDATVKAYARALALTEARHRAGIVPGLDVAQAQTQLDTARSQVAQTLARRALVEHAIAGLLGVTASKFDIPPGEFDLKLPHIPVGVPASLLERRPDIAAAQRRMFAANAEIGVARAAYFPSLTLDAQGGFESSAFADWLSAPSAYWAIGPNVLLSVFDGGLRRARVAQARAEFNVSSENYRGVVLNAFQQVEDALAELNHYYDAAQQEQSAVIAAQHALDLSLVLYKQGATDYLSVITAQATLLQSQLQTLNLQALQLLASVDLIRALGGGWEDRLANVTETSRLRTSASCPAPLGGCMP